MSSKSQPGRVDARQVRYILDTRPSPQGIYLGNGITVRVYKTRNLRGDWTSDSLRDLTLLCRQSYSRYGGRELLDEYDTKSAIYIARVSYSIPGKYGALCPVEEFLSARIVPGDGEPQGAGELEINIIKGERMDSVVKNAFLGGREDFWNFIFASSRMCGIHPLYLNERDEHLNLPLSIKHQYSAYCYALLNYQFLLDYQDNFWFMTGIISDDFVNNVLTLHHNGKDLKPEFTPAYKFLGIHMIHAPRIDRTIYTYKFPMYWLKVEQLISSLEKLLKEDILTESTFSHYLQTNTAFSEIAKSRTSLDLAKLGNLLTAEGLLEGANITGQELRRIIDENVSDEPELKITDNLTWRKGLEDFVKHSDLVVVQP